MTRTKSESDSADNKTAPRARETQPRDVQVTASRGQVVARPAAQPYSFNLDAPCFVPNERGFSLEAPLFGPATAETTQKRQRTRQEETKATIRDQAIVVRKD